MKADLNLEGARDFKIVASVTGPMFLAKEEQALHDMIDWLVKQEDVMEGKSMWKAIMIIPGRLGIIAGDQELENVDRLDTYDVK